MVEVPPTRRFALLLEYDGTRFSGSQLQPNARTVQGVLEETIAKVTGEASRVAFAGRTDAGVHALGQVGAFTSATHLYRDVLQRALNAVLPEDVVVRSMASIAPDFDPRRRAVRRQYRYVIDNGDTRTVLGRERAWHVAGPLDVEAMAIAGRSIEGTHDFTAFASALEDADASTVRNLERLSAARRGEGIEFEAIANAFLPHQVRRMVGALVEVGRGRLSPASFAAFLEGAPSTAGPAAPARGLTLVGVAYPEALFTGLDSDGPVW